MKALFESGWIIAGMQALWEAAPARPIDPSIVYPNLYQPVVKVAEGRFGRANPSKMGQLRSIL
jgi:hypothetical protein